jgi:hypothetical protein
MSSISYTQIFENNQIDVVLCIKCEKDVGPLVKREIGRATFPVGVFKNVATGECNYNIMLKYTICDECAIKMAAPYVRGKVFVDMVEKT